MSTTRVLKYAVAAAAVVLASQAMAQITLYEREGFRGRAVTTDRPVRNLDRMDFDDRAGSIVVDRGRWEVCDQPRFEGRCAVLRRGNYDSLRDMGMNNQISSIRPADERRRYDNEPVASQGPAYEYRRRANERVHEVPVNWSRAVMGQANQRCWVERQAVQTAPSNSNIGGAVAGAVLGGILGHQVGGGSGKDAATAVGAIAGAAIGNQMGNSGQPGVATQDVQRCGTAASGPPAYYEVSYNFRGQEHRIQMANPPGATVLVNERGEPRM
jgi:uncharacterized protein YcfJ